jgi:CDP-glucose 4,6-dehydratase
MNLNKNFWKNKRFKGSWLTIWLNSMGAKVLGYSLKPPTKPSLFIKSGIYKKIKTINGDIRNKKKLYTAIKNFKPNIIFHLAAQSLVLESYKKPLETYETNFNGTLNLLDTVKKLKIKSPLIIITSDKCYQNINKKKGYKEIDKLGGSDPYSGSKGATEILCKSYFDSFFRKKNIIINPLATARAGNVIGGGDWSKNRIVPDVIRTFFNNKILKLRYPKATRPWQHVLEPLYGYILLAEKLYRNQSKFSGAWNFGPKISQKKTVEYLVSQLKKYWPYSQKIKVNINKNNSKKKEDKLLHLNYSKSKKYLKWKPKWNTQKTIKQTINWYAKYYKNENIYKACLSDINEYINY